MQNWTDNKRLQHLNIPQQKVHIINAKICVAILGRGTGKTFGIIAPQSIRNAQAFPRGAEAMVGPSLVKVHSDLMAAWTDSMEKWGFYEDVDYWYGKRIPNHINHDKPFQNTKFPQNSVFFRNGHVKRLIGTDHNGTSGNALSNDYVTVDEAKQINVKKFNSRIVPTNRGNEDLEEFTQWSFHHGFTYCSDQPTSPESQWLLEFEHACDLELMELIANFSFEEASLKKCVDLLTAEQKASLKQLHKYIDQFKEEYDIILSDLKKLTETDKLFTALEARMRKRLAEVRSILYDLRKDAVFFLESSTLDNIDVVGADYIKQMELVLTPFEFDTSILGKRVKATEYMFYSGFNEEIHVDDATINYTYVNLIPDLRKGIPTPWRKDLDLDHTIPLQVACDWGSRINCMVVGQEHPDLFRFVNEFYVLNPLKIPHLAKKFVDYYEGYPNRDVIFYYDHTADFEDSSRTMTFAEEFIQELEKYGWNVEPVYIGQASWHEARYRMWARVYSGECYPAKPVMYNKHNCPKLIISTQQAGALDTSKGVAKDKRPEKNDSVKQEEATHFTDAKDTLYIGAFRERQIEGEYDYGMAM